VSATGGAVEAVHNALYGVLSADSTLAGLSLTADNPTVTVLNDAVEGQLYPYVEISRPTETPMHTFGGASTGLGWNVIARVHSYSRYQGDREAARMNGRVIALTNFQSIAVSGFTSATWEVISSRILVEDKEKVETRHGVVEIRVKARQ
jgi:hypothetical protein